jgi:hypothetical protein
VAWDIVYYKTADGRVPATEFLDGCPVKVAANLLAVLDAVAEAPPPQYSGGGKWTRSWPRPGPTRTSRVWPRTPPGFRSTADAPDSPGAT